MLSTTYHFSQLTSYCGFFLGWFLHWSTSISHCILIRRSFHCTSGISTNSSTNLMHIWVRCSLRSLVFFGVFLYFGSYFQLTTEEEVAFFLRSHFISSLPEPIRSLLFWPGWSIPSRLTYATYLVHVITIKWLFDMNTLSPRFAGFLYEVHL